MKDIVIPIAYPDYKIAVNTPKATIEVPDLIPGFDILPDKVTIPETKNKLPYLGHAGILFIKGSTGTTKYYEYGRYQTDKGEARKVTLSDVKMKNGYPTKSTLTYTLSQISAKAGQKGRILAAFIEVTDKYDAMLAYAKKRVSQNKISSRKPYSLTSNSCNHFMQGVLEAAGLDLPTMVDPRPTSYIEEIRDMYPDLDYSRAEHSLVIENPPKSLAYNGPLTQPAAA